MVCLPPLPETVIRFVTPAPCVDRAGHRAGLPKRRVNADENGQYVPSNRCIPAHAKDLQSLPRFIRTVTMRWSPRRCRETGHRRRPAVCPASRCARAFHRCPTRLGQFQSSASAPRPALARGSVASRLSREATARSMRNAGVGTSQVWEEGSEDKSTSPQPRRAPLGAVVSD